MTHCWFAGAYAGPANEQEGREHNERLLVIDSPFHLIPANRGPANVLLQ